LFIASSSGLVAKLIDLKDPKAALALETVAGGKMYQVVVDTAETGKALLEKGKLKTRVTVIPLNKMSQSTLSDEKILAAQRVAGKDGKSKVQLALSLVGCEEEVKAAMAYVFGHTLVCDTSETAKAVSFHKEVKIRSVTLDGDVYDPRGTLTGGKAQGSGVCWLLKLQELQQLCVELGEMKAELTKLEADQKSLATQGKEFRDIQKKLELKTHEQSLLKEQFSLTEGAQLQARVKQLSNEIREAEEKLANAQDTATTSMSKLKEIKGELKNAEAKRNSELKKLETEIQGSKNASAKASKRFKEKQQALRELRLERDELKKDSETALRQVVLAEELLEKLSQEESCLEKECSEARERYDNAKKVLDEYKERLDAYDNDLKALNKQQQKAMKDLSTLQIEMKKLQHKISRFHKDKGEAEKRVEGLLHVHPWIKSEKQFFGRAHTDYDFTSQNPKAALSELKKLKDQQASLGKKINKKVMGMIEKAEQEYNDLMDKKSIIEKDKVKIQSVITELNTKKNEVLKTTWQKVNKDFGSIFSTLLPGTNAKLEPPEGMTVLDGLEVKVAFGGVWKDSLTELSGGQRSLVALSIILSLLLFKPAPMYILDEVDAALDLSHTQNIGQMLRTHFSYSQFIVVSLKEGMFNNANVVFRTKFVDGVSTVTRTTPNKHLTSK
jgi:structural maintenance of chromosome 2